MSSTGEAGGGGATRSVVTEGAVAQRRCEGERTERIGVAFALEADGLQLREAFDVGAVFREDLDAFDEVDE